ILDSCLRKILRGAMIERRVKGCLAGKNDDRNCPEIWQLMCGFALAVTRNEIGSLRLGLLNGLEFRRISHWWIICERNSRETPWLRRCSRVFVPVWRPNESHVVKRWVAGFKSDKCFDELRPGITKYPEKISRLRVANNNRRTNSVEERQPCCLNPLFNLTGRADTIHLRGIELIEDRITCYSCAWPLGVQACLRPHVITLRDRMPRLHTRT